ncbi:MAG: hypothetical protein A2538_04105 [Candidatus Magasanikbacteria bacterium RIFOXYD2_FULL_41_14]|uniref:PRC-barrel domain-containing protein n=1 Tax=Candidatus Magasanikbacteria bacterium RIFOXYD2_FULL_41_14 TaxID=1798709 RepID=A0A1F6PGH5_9BACT|nr:MAG: hypothetical protein A2538_04105 [Candidatus Magasanikbacteria bacterium RIFOXYD2_FULL_41_14]
MPRVNFSQLKKLPVYTQSGVYLGKVVDAILSAEDNLILQYKVRSRFIGGRIFLINSSQVVEIKADRLVVEDALSAEVVAPIAISTKQVAES